MLALVREHGLRRTPRARRVRPASCERRLVEGDLDALDQQQQVQHLRVLLGRRRARSRSAAPIAVTAASAPPAASAARRITRRRETAWFSTNSWLNDGSPKCGCAGRDTLDHRRTESDHPTGGERARDSPNGQAAGPRADHSRRRGILRAVTRTQMLIAAVVFGSAFAVASIIRGDVLPGLVGGVLGGLLLYLVLVRVQEHNEAIKRRKEREDR